MSMLSLVFIDRNSSKRKISDLPHTEWSNLDRRTSHATFENISYFAWLFFRLKNGKKGTGCFTEVILFNSHFDSGTNILIFQRTRISKSIIKPPQNTHGESGALLAISRSICSHLLVLSMRKPRPRADRWGLER